MERSQINRQIRDLTEQHNRVVRQIEQFVESLGEQVSSARNRRAVRACQEARLAIQKILPLVPIGIPEPLETVGKKPEPKKPEPKKPEKVANG